MLAVHIDGVSKGLHPKIACWFCTPWVIVWDKTLFLHLCFESFLPVEVSRALCSLCKSTISGIIVVLFKPADQLVHRLEVLVVEVETFVLDFNKLTSELA